MPNEQLLEAIKTGLKAEKDSITVYTEAAKRSEGAVSAFFQERADEEKKHFNWLLQYFRQLGDRAVPADFSNLFVPDTAPMNPAMFSEDFLRRVAADQYVSTAIATALLLEVNAMRHYRQAAEKTVHQALRDFFTSLAEWEDKHYRDLLKIQEESERYWFDVQQFEPF